jgi:hypothetical protein
LLFKKKRFIKFCLFHRRYEARLAYSTAEILRRFNSFSKNNNTAPPYSDTWYYQVCSKNAIVVLLYGGETNNSIGAAQILDGCGNSMENNNIK